MTMALGIMGGIVGAMGSMASGANQQAMYNYQASVALVQRQEALQGAWYQYAAGYSQAEQVGMKGKQQLGQVIAAQGASNLQVGGDGSAAWGSSSSTAVQASVRGVNMLNELTTQNNFSWNAYQELATANDFTNQANLDIYAGSIAKQSSEISAMSSLIGGFSGAGAGQSRLSQFGGGNSFGTLESLPLFGG